MAGGILMSNISDIVSPKNYPEHKGVVFAISPKDGARAITWFTPDCHLCVHWEDEYLNVIEEGKGDYVNKLNGHCSMQDAMYKLARQYCLMFPHKHQDELENEIQEMISKCMEIS
jgi:hypothetical protein